MKDMVNKITDSTLVPIGIVAVIAGCMFWISALYWNTMANAKNIEELKADKAQLQKDISEIKLGVSELKQSVNDIKERL